MAGPGRENHDVACREIVDLAVIAAKTDLRPSARNAEHFVGARMIMDEAVNAVAPGVSPAVAPEQFLEYGSRIAAVREIHGAAIEDEGKPRIIGNGAVVLEHGGVRLAAAPARLSRMRGGLTNSGDGLERLHIFF